jgi:head-tail adaptor
MASGLTSGDLVRMRSVLDDTVLPGTAIVYSRTRVADGMGGNTVTYTASGTVSARLDYLGEQEEADVRGNVTSTNAYVLTVPNTTTVVDTGRVEFDSVTYEVRAVLVADPWDLCQRVELARVD